MKLQHRILIAGAVLALALAVMPAASGAHYAALDENDVSNEPDQPTDTNPLNATGDTIPGNGFGDRVAGSFDLVLDGYVVPEDGYVFDPNTVLSEVVAQAGQSHEPVIYPGTVDYNAWFGWWFDRGSGANTNDLTVEQEGEEVDVGGATFASDDPNEAIDDDDDDDAESWDEFFQGRNGVPSWAGSFSNADSDVAPFSNHADEMLLFVDPGTQGRQLAFALGSPKQTGPSRPGYGVIGTAPDNFDVPDDVCGAGNDEDNQTPGEPLSAEDAGDRWHCVTGVITDRSLLVATRTRVAVNPGPASGDAVDPSGSPTQLSATDTDHWSTLNPTVGEAYQTAVWDPNDEQDDNVGENVGWEKGLKGRANEAYSDDFTTAVRLAGDVVAEALEPTQPARGVATDYTVSPPRMHEPNHPEDEYPGAERPGPNDPGEPAAYNGNVANAPYYEPNDQSWQGYEDEEQLWADFEARYTVLPNLLLFPDQMGTNVNGIGSPDEQQTQTPGFLLPFARVGTWLDTSGDTWLGNQHPKFAYDNGTDSDPNVYGSSEFNSLCSDVKTSTTFYPAHEAEQDNDGDGDVDIHDRPWGETGTGQPQGVFFYNSFGGGLLGGLYADIVGDQQETVDHPQLSGTPLGDSTTVTLADDNDDERLSQYIQYGPIDVGIGGCSGDADAGYYFPGDAIILPTGSVSYPIKMEATADFTNPGDVVRRTGEVPDATIQDVDVINSWT